MVFEDHRQRSDYDSYQNSEDGDIFYYMQQRSLYLNIKRSLKER